MRRVSPLPLNDLRPEVILYRLTVIAGLVELRKRGVLQRVWCDDFRLAIQYPPAPGESELLCPRLRIGWKSAERLIAQYVNVNRKPVSIQAPVRKAAVA